MNLYRLIEDEKVVGFEKHENVITPDGGIKIFHTSRLNEERQCIKPEIKY